MFSYCDSPLTSLSRACAHGCKYSSKGNKTFIFHSTSSSSCLRITRVWRTRPLLTGLEEMTVRKWLQRRFTLEDKALPLAVYFWIFRFFSDQEEFFICPRILNGAQSLKTEIVSPSFQPTSRLHRLSGTLAASGSKGRCQLSVTSLGET